MNSVIVLAPNEIVRLDPDRLSGLYAQLGEHAAEDVVCRAMEELALRLAKCEQMFRTGEDGDLHKCAKSLVAIADQIGMTVLARVAQDVVHCIDTLDRNALAATLSRLLRIGEGSLMAVWDLQDMTI